MLAKNEKGRRNVLLIHGDKDVSVPHTHSNRLQAHLQDEDYGADITEEMKSGGEVIVALVEGAGHLVPFTHSKQVAKLIQHHMCCL